MKRRKEYTTYKFIKKKLFLPKHGTNFTGKKLAERKAVGRKHRFQFGARIVKQKIEIYKLYIRKGTPEIFTLSVGNILHSYFTNRKFFLISFVTLHFQK